jgi:DNA topoisomerase IB
MKILNTFSIILEKTIPELKGIEFFVYKQKKYPIWGNVHGRNKTVISDFGKFNRYARLGSIADTLIEKFKRNLKEDPYSKESRCSFACLLMMLYGIRVGNEDSAEGYISGLKNNSGLFVQTYGTTTLLNKHVEVKDNSILLNFLGKKQVDQHIKVNDPLIVKIAKLYDSPIKQNEKWIGISQNELTSFIKTEVGKNFTPKDFRTFCANITAWNSIKKKLNKKKYNKKSDAKNDVKEVVEDVSTKLGNTPGIAKKSYLDARMLDWFYEQRLSDEIRSKEK